MGIYTRRNDDMYMFRLDFPHKNSEYIHINLQEKENKDLKDSAFPFNFADIKVLNLSSEQLKSLFFEMDGSWYFRNGKKSKISTLNASETVKNELREILKTRGHYKILESKDEDEFFKFVTDYSNVLSNMDLDVLKLEESHRDEKVQINILEELWNIYCEI